MEKYPKIKLVKESVNDVKKFYLIYTSNPDYTNINFLWLSHTEALSKFREEKESESGVVILAEIDLSKKENGQLYASYDSSNSGCIKIIKEYFGEDNF